MKKDSMTFELSQPAPELFRLWSNFEGLDGLPDLTGVEKTGARSAHIRFTKDGHPLEFEARITGLEPNRRLAWTSISGLQNEGEVTLEPLGDDRTRVTLRFSYAEPSDAAEEVDDTFAAHSAALRS